MPDANREGCVLGVSLTRVLTELVSKMRDMQMDKTELGCLRAIVLFNPGNRLQTQHMHTHTHARTQRSGI